jgi:hypothetical protein
MGSIKVTYRYHASVDRSRLLFIFQTASQEVNNKYKCVVVDDMPTTRSMAISESPILASRASATTGETGRLGTQGPPGGALRRLMPFRMVRARLISRSLGEF